MMLYIHWLVGLHLVFDGAGSKSSAGALPGNGRALATWTNTLPSPGTLQLKDADGLEMNAVGPSALVVAVGQPFQRLALLAPSGDEFVADGARMRLVLSTVNRAEAEQGACLDPETSLSEYAVDGNFASPEGASIVDSGSDHKLYANVSMLTPLVFKVGGSFRVCYSDDGSFTRSHVDVVAATINVTGAYSSCKAVGCLGETSTNCYIRKRAHSAAGACVLSIKSHGQAGKVKLVARQAPLTTGKESFNCTSLPSSLLCSDGWKDSSPVCDGGEHHIKPVYGAGFPARPAFNQSGEYVTLPQTVGYLSGTSVRAYSLAACYCPAYEGCQSEDSYTQQVGIVYFYASKVCAPGDAACLSSIPKGVGYNDGFSGVSMGVPWLLVVLCASSNCVGESETSMKLVDWPDRSTESYLDHRLVCGTGSQTLLLVHPSDYSGEFWCNTDNLDVNETCADANTRVFGAPEGFRLENDKFFGTFSRSFAKTKILGVCFCLQACGSPSSWFQVGFVHVSPFTLSQDSGIEVPALRVVNVPGVVSFYLSGEDIDSLGLNTGGTIKILNSSIATDSMCNETPGDPDIIPVFLKERIMPTVPPVQVAEHAFFKNNGRIQMHLDSNGTFDMNGTMSLLLDNGTNDTTYSNDTNDTDDINHTFDYTTVSDTTVTDTTITDTTDDTAGANGDAGSTYTYTIDITNATDVGKICSTTYAENAYHTEVHLGCEDMNDTSCDANSTSTTTTSTTRTTSTTSTTSVTTLDPSTFMDGFHMLLGRQENCTAADPVACPGASKCCQQLNFDGRTAHYVLQVHTAGVRSVCYCAPPQDCSAPEAQWLLAVPLVVRGPFLDQEWSFPSYVAVTMEVAGVSLAGTDSLRIAAPGESCDGDPCAAQNILIGCPDCIPFSEQDQTHIPLRPLAHNAIRCDEAHSNCDFVPIVSLIANSTSLIITFSKDPALADGDLLTLGREVSCVNSCSDDQLAAIRGVHLYGGSGTQGEYALGHKVIRIANVKSHTWITNIPIGKSVPKLNANGASWQLLNRGSVAGELTGGPVMSLPVCWSSGVNNHYSAKAGQVSFIAPKSSLAQLDVTARQAGVTAPVILTFTSHMTEIDELLAAGANAEVELVIRFFNLTLLRPVSVRDAITSYGLPIRDGAERSATAIRRHLNSQGVCGEWFSEMWADDVHGFPIAHGCSFTPEHAGGREITIHFDRRNSLKRQCQRPTKDGDTIADDCHYQLVFHAELGELAADTPLLDVYLMCRSGCGSPYHIMMWSTARARAAVVAQGDASHNEPRIKSFSVVGTDTVMNTLQLVDQPSSAGQVVDVDLRVSIDSGSGWKTKVIRFFLAPFALWDVHECHSTVGTSISGPCQMHLLGLSHAAVDCSVEDVLQPSPHPTDLSLQLTPPRLGLGFFPKQLAAEVISERAYSSAVDSSLSYKQIDGFLWRGPQSVDFVLAFQGATQLVTVGRTGYGSKPFVHEVNTLTFKLVAFATTMRLSDPADASVDLVLPRGFECLSVTKINHSASLEHSLRHDDLIDEDMPQGWLQDPGYEMSGGRLPWEQLSTNPEICRFSLGEYQALFAGQVLSARVSFKNPPASVSARSPENRWSLSLRSRGLILDSTLVMELSHPLSTTWAETSSKEFMWQGNVGVLDRIQDAFVHPLHLQASQFLRNEVSIFFRLSQSLGSGSFMVIDALSGFEFLGCVVQELPQYRYDSYDSGTLQAPKFQDSCIATWWPCFEVLQPSSYAHVDRACARGRSDLSGQSHKPRDRAILNVAESLHAGVAYGFQMTLGNPVMYAVESHRQGWWLWTRDIYGHGVDGTTSAVSFNSLVQQAASEPLEQTWSVYEAMLNASVTVDGLQPYSISGHLQLIVISLTCPRSGFSDARLLAPEGYAWGSEHGNPQQVCGATLPPWMLRSIADHEGFSGQLWPDEPCSVTLNAVTWGMVLLTAGSQYRILLQVRIPDRTPIMGANAFFVELGYSQTSLDQRWAAAAIGSDAFHVQALSNAGVSSSCTVVGFHTNHVCFSVRLPTAIPPGGLLRIHGVEYTSNLLFRRDCEVQRCETPVSGAHPLPDDLACKFEALGDNRPQISITPKTGWPSGFFAFELIAQNPTLPTEVPGIWVFETFADAHGAILDRQISVAGFRLRSAMRSAGFLGLSAEMLAALGGDRRLAHFNQVIISFVLDVQLAGAAPFQLRIMAPTGFVFPENCQADVPEIEGIQHPFGWSDALQGCAGQGQLAFLSIALEMKPDIQYILRISVVNPSVEAVRTQSESGEWALQFMDQASEPFPTFALQMFYNLYLQPASAAYGAKHMPVLLAFTPFSTVPEHPKGRLVLTAPVGFHLSEARCSVKEQGGACENCVAENGEWCAQDDFCGERGESTCPSQYSSAQKQRQGLPPCSFEILPADFRCSQTEDPSVLILSMALSYSSEAHSARGGFSKGRRYDLTFTATNPNASVEGLGEWRLQSQIEVHDGTDTEELDLGEVNGFALHHAASNWSVVNPDCIIAGDEQVASEAFLRLPHDVQAEDVLEVTAPPGVKWPSSFESDCAQDLIVAFPEHRQERECSPLVPVMSTQTTTTSGVGSSSTSLLDIVGETDMNFTWLGLVNASDETEEAGSTTTSTTSLTVQRRLQLSDSTLCKSNDCIQCVCTARCRILLRGLHLTAGDPLRWTILAKNPMEPPRLVENFWHVAHFSEGIRLSEGSSMSWPVQTQLVHAAVLLTPPDGGPRRVGTISTIRVELTPLRAASSFEISTAIPGFDFSHAIVDQGSIIAAKGHSLLVRIDLNIQLACQVSMASVRLGNIGGPTTFTLVTYSSTGEIRDKRMNFEGFRLPGTLDIVSASLQRDVPHPYLRDQSLPARTGEPATFVINFHIGLRVQAGSFLHVVCSSSWSLSSDPESNPRVSGGGLQVSRGPVEQFGIHHVAFTLNASLNAVSTMYKVEILALPSSSASPLDQWTLSVLDGSIHPVATNDGMDLEDLLDPIAAQIVFDMQMGRPPPGGQLRVTFRFPSFKDLPSIVDIVVVPPPGWKGPPVRGKDCIDISEDESAHRDHTLVRNLNLASSTNIDFGTPCVSDPDVLNWYVLVAPVGGPQDQLLAWGDGQGTLVAHMRAELRHASLAGLEETTLILSFQLGQETEVGSIIFSAPFGYMDIACQDKDDAYDPPRWMMRMKSLQPKCKQHVNGAGLHIDINASMGAGTWGIGLIGTLPEEPSADAHYHVMVRDRFGNLIDAAYAQPGPELQHPEKWRVREPYLVLLSRDEDGVLGVAVGFTVRDIVIMQGNETIKSSISALSIRAIRISLPPGLYTAVDDVKLDLAITRDTGSGDALPFAEDGKRVTRGAVFLMLLDDPTVIVANGRYEVQFPVILPGEAPNDNVWTLEFCSEATCSGDSLNFPLVGFSEGERAVPSKLAVETSPAFRCCDLSTWHWICLLLSCAILTVWHTKDLV